MNALDTIGRTLCYLIGILVITGGIQLTFGSARIEISQVNIFGFLLLILAAILTHKKIFEKSTTHSMLSKFLSWLGKLGKDRNKFLAALGVVFSWLLLTHLIRHFTLNTDYMDVSCLHQPLFYPFSPTLLHCDACRNGTQMAEHITWIMILISPLFSWLKSDLWVFVFKSLAVASGVYFLITKGDLKNKTALWGFALFVLFASKTFRGSQVWDFREDDLAFVFLAIAILGLINKRFLIFWMGAIFAMITKENMPLVTLFFAPILLLNSELKITKKQRYVHAAGIAVVSLVYAGLVFRFFIPHFLGEYGNVNNIVLRFPGMGNSAAEVVTNLFLKPRLVWNMLLSNVFTFNTLEYVVVLVLPFLSFGFSPWLIGAVPGLAMNTLASMGTQKMMIFHYDLIILPFLFAGFCSRLAQAESGINFKGKCVFALLLAFCVFDRSPSAEITERLFTHGYRIPAAFRLGDLKIDGPVAANSKIWAHLNHLKSLRLLNFPDNRQGDSFSFEEFKSMNPPRSLGMTGRDPRDAQFVVLQTEVPWEKSLGDRLISRGDQLIASWPQDIPQFMVLQLSKPLFE